MNFPETPFFEWLYWLINTPGLGGVVVGLLALFILVAVFFTLRWIARGAEADEKSEYAYPTPALLHSDDNEA
jgi:hypothetical protein